MVSPVGSVFDMLALRMDYLTQRQAVISQNVSNSDTPNYKARDLAPFADALNKNVTTNGAIRMATTNASHLRAAGSAGSGDFTMARPAAYETLPTGNNVVLEEQMMKVAEIASEYQLATNVYKRMQGMVRTALGRAGAA